MATKTPRIQVTLSPRSHALVTRLADLQNGSRSKVIAELVDELAPHMEKVLELLEAASSIKAERREAVREQAASLLDLMMPHAEAAQASLDALAGVLEDASQEVEGEGQPPYSNTGVRSGLSHCNSSKWGDAA